MPEPGEKWPESAYNQSIRSARIHFPVGQCLHDGGTQRFRKWAEVLRGLANTLDALSQAKGVEGDALSFGMQAIHGANLKIGGYRHGAHTF